MVLHQTSAQSVTALHVHTSAVMEWTWCFLVHWTDRPTSAMVILHPTYLQGFVSSKFFNVLTLWMIWCGSCQIVDDMVWFWCCVFPGGGKLPWRVGSQILALVWMNCIWSSLSACQFIDKESGHCIVASWIGKLYASSPFHSPSPCNKDYSLDLWSC